MTIPTGPMTRALTDKERKAVKAERWRLSMMLQDDDMYWRRGEKPPERKPEPKYTADDLRRDRPDLFERTKLPKGDSQRLTLPKAKREAGKRNLLPPGVYYFKTVNGRNVPISREEHMADMKNTGMVIVSSNAQDLLDEARGCCKLPVNPTDRSPATRPGWDAWGDEIGASP